MLNFENYYTIIGNLSELNSILLTWPSSYPNDIN